MRFNPDERYGSVKAVKAALILNRILPFAVLSVLGAAVCTVLVVFLNYRVNSNDPEPKSDYNIESISNQSILDSDISDMESNGFDESIAG